MAPGGRGRYAERMQRRPSSLSPRRKVLFSAVCGALVFGAAAIPPALAGDTAYEIDKGDAKVAIGATTIATLTIKARGGWHVNAEAPITVALTAPAGVSLKKEKLSRGDLAASSAESARFEIPVSATEAGKKTINAETRFVMCQQSACKPVKETVTLAVEVLPAAAASGGPAKKKAH